MRFNILFFVFLWTIAYPILGCSNQKNDLDLFYRKLTLNINDLRVIERIRAADSLESIERLIPIFSIELNLLLSRDDSSISGSLNRYDSFFTSKTLRYRQITLLYGFNQYLNGETFLIENLLDEVRSYYDQKSVLFEESKIKSNYELMTIVQKNYKKWSESDTIDLKFHVLCDTNYRQVFFKSYPRSQDYNQFDDDTLLIKGIIKEKYFGSEYEDSMRYKDLIFQVEVLETSDTLTYYTTQMLKVGSNLNLNLAGYGNPI